MIDELKKNIDTEIEILKEIVHYNSLLPGSSPSEQHLLLTTIDSLQNSLKIVHNSIPEIVAELSVAQKLPSGTNSAPKSKFERINYSGDVAMSVVLKSEDKEKLLNELKISEDLIKKIKKNSIKSKKEKEESFQKSRGYIKLANKIFIPLSKKFVEKGKFKQLSIELRKANFNILLESYVSVIFFTCFLSFLITLLLVLFLSFFEINLSTFSINLAENPFLRLLKFSVAVILVPLIVFLVMYIYPSTEKNTIAKRIDWEIPFATIHMSAIANSGIEPTNIFRIIALSKEYPYFKKDIKKVLNQINLYGYDLVTALSNVSKTTPSKKASELFSGLATTINTGGDLSEFFEKRAETLMLDYKLEREKFTNTAETLMDIYITIAIAAPMVLLLVLVLLSVSNIGPNLSPGISTLIIILVLTVLNVGFLVLVHLKQPSY